MANDLILLWLAALPLMGSPGPATLSLAGIGTAYGVRQGIGYLGGIIVGTFGVLVMIASGVTALILAQPALVVGLSIVAAIYILYLAWKIATAPVGVDARLSQRAPSLPSGFLLAIANPKAFAAIGAVYAGYTLVEGDVFADGLAKVAALTLVIVLVNSVWLVLGSWFATALRDPRYGRIANITFAAMLIASVALVLLPG